MGRRQKVKPLPDGALAARLRGHEAPRPDKGKTTRHLFLRDPDHHERFILAFALLLLLAATAFTVLMRVHTAG